MANKIPLAELLEKNPEYWMRKIWEMEAEIADIKRISLENQSAIRRLWSRHGSHKDNHDKT